MMGTSWIRRQGLDDALLTRLMTERGLTEIPMYAAQSDETRRLSAHPRSIAHLRDGPVAEARSTRSPDAHADLVRDKGLALGAALIGMTRLQPEFVEIGHEVPHEWVIGVVVREDYANVLKGAEAVHNGAFATYARCADISTALARYIREELGYPAIAHHNGASAIQALPALYRMGVGELGRHGSLINPELGAFWRPGFVTTDLPLVSGEPISFGVQDYCVNCRLCETACPGDAVAPADDYILTDGVKRWLIDNEKCFPISRLRDEYCHICVDVCPYIHKENGDPALKQMFKSYVGERKKAGFDKPKEQA